MLNIQHFTKIYSGGHKAVDDLSLFVAPGDIYGFIGRNGAGKTTTIKSVCGVIDFDEGEITIDGHSIKSDPIAAKQVLAYIPDNPDLYEHLTGIQYLTFISAIYGVPKEEFKSRLTHYAETFELTGALGDLVGSYSHGMKQKLSIIAAMIHQPKLLILDEPFVGLDPKASLTLKGIMHELVEEGGAIFFSTHVLDVAEKLCNKIAIIRDGRLIADGEIEAVKGNQSLEDVFMEVSEGIDKNKVEENAADAVRESTDPTAGVFHSTKSGSSGLFRFRK